ncbi:hypothetical protein [Butyrivibrio sp. WCD2001]|uniref:hypothetical protein n=1 Tax=Butyrivibrio sp. WCD2001 TaxID=1280681 RepID=UPI0003FA3FDA|nr:hypothetical protein [Butyrivibrio sp. WCD2001]
MKTLLSLCNIRRKLLAKNSVLVIPTVATAIFIGAMYSVKPVFICSSFLMSSFFIYIIGVFISMTLQAKENDVFEETLLLHCESGKSYYLSRELIMFGINCIYTLILLGYPIIRYLSDNNFFTRNMTAFDVIFGGLIIFVSGLAGMEVGDFFHPRIFTKRRDSIIGAIFVSVLAICKLGLIDNYPILKVPCILLPPIMDSFKLVGDSDIFSPAGMLLICIHMVGYFLVIMLLKIKLLGIKKFRF